VNILSWAVMDITTSGNSVFNGMDDLPPDAISAKSLLPALDTFRTYPFSIDRG
jgi:hypothetical protein